MSHSIYAPSKAERWVRCPGSLKLEQVLDVDQFKNQRALEGDKVHSYIERITNNENFSIGDREIEYHVINYLKFLESEMEEGYSIYIEKVLSFENIVKGGFGTADCVILGPGRLKIIDFKYGYYKIQAKDNYQLMMYALAALNTFKLDNVSIIDLFIYQPRAYNNNGYSMGIKKLMEFKQDVKDSINESKKDKPVFNVTAKGCQWCPVKLKCDALKDFVSKNFL